jgi:hypothetical protein
VKVLTAPALTLAKPKSRILAWPLLVTKVLGGFDVAANHALAVRGVESVGHIRRERLAIQKFHGGCSYDE